MNRLVKFFTACLIVLTFLIALLGGSLSCTSQTPVSYAKTSDLIAKQFDGSSCLMGAIATHLNYKVGRPDYTARGLALAYTALYGTSDWYKDGNTSHQAQDLVRFAGFTPVYERLTDNGNDPVGLLKWLAYSGKMPLVFLSGTPEHAIVLIGAYIDTVYVADPLSGSVSASSAYELYNRLDGWVFYTL